MRKKVESMKNKWCDLEGIIIENKLIKGKKKIGILFCMKIEGNNWNIVNY